MKSINGLIVFWIAFSYTLFYTLVKLSALMVLLAFVLQKWHPDKHKDQDSATSKFQEINEAYQG